MFIVFFLIFSPKELILIMIQRLRYSNLKTPSRSFIACGFTQKKLNCLSLEIKPVCLFSQSKPVQPAELDELSTYQTYLRKHNQSLKKPHEKLRTEEERIFNKYIENSRESQLIDFMVNNSNLRLCNINTALLMDNHLTKIYSQLNAQQKRDAAYSLLSFREPRLFSLFKKQREVELAATKLQDINVEDLMIYLYGQLINLKSINFLKNIQTSVPKPKIIEAVYQCLSYSSYKGKYQSQRLLLMLYFKILLNPSLNKVESNKGPEKKRSILQTDIQAFLKVMEYNIVREMSVNTFMVDYIVENKTKQSKIALEINGSYHYTLNNKIKGREILRNIIINQCLPLRIVHHQDYLLSRGYRNKQAYLQEVINSSIVNWECKHKGTNSQWEVSQTQEFK